MCTCDTVLQLPTSPALLCLCFLHPPHTPQHPHAPTSAYPSARCILNMQPAAPSTLLTRQGKARTCEKQACLGPCLLVWGSRPARLTSRSAAASVSLRARRQRVRLSSVYPLGAVHLVRVGVGVGVGARGQGLGLGLGLGLVVSG